MRQLCQCSSRTPSAHTNTHYTHCTRWCKNNAEDWTKKKRTKSMKMKNVHVECIPPNVFSRKSLNVRLWVCSECICVCGWLVLLFFFLFLFCLSFVVAGRRHFVVVVHLLLIPVWAPSFRHYLLHFYARNKLSVSCFVVHRVVYFIDIFFNRHSHMSLNLCALFFLILLLLVAAVLFLSFFAFI